MGARLLLAFASIAIASCTRHAGQAVDGVVVFDQVVQLARAAKRDLARREIKADRDATFVAFV